jgi:prepilin-type N-terminal cleavage/methylation domain-containing protein
MYPLHNHRPMQRSGLTLLELLIAVAVTSMIAAAMGALARTVQIASTYSQGVCTAVQHARVSLERIQRTISEATANQNFPGAVVFADTVSGQSMPDTLVVWHPTSTAANPTGLPLYCELVVYCPNPAAPNQLLEITSPNDTRTVPVISDTSDWQTNLAAMKATNSQITQTLLTDLMRGGSPSSSGNGATLAGCVRFVAAQHPTAADWTNYQTGKLTWANMSWAQGIYGTTTGLAQTWVRIELQMMPGYTATNDPTGQQVLPFLGSAALNYQLHQ